MVMKIHNYHQLLTDYINANLGKPFAWGEMDCTTFAIGAIEAMIGREADKPDFTYRTREEAENFSKTYRLSDGMKSQLNAYEVPRNFHQPGDIAFIQVGDLEGVHVVFDRRVYAPSFNGVVEALNIHQLYEKYPEMCLLRFD